MSYGTQSSSSHQRMITAFFDSRQDANEAVERLVAAGIPRNGINVMEGTQQGTSTSSSRSTTDDGDTGFWDSLKDMFLPDEDRATYAEGLRRGGTMVSVRAPDAMYDRAIDILDDEGTIDMEERETQYRSEGFTGASAYTGRSGTTSERGMGGVAAAASGLGAALTGQSSTDRTTTSSTTGTAGSGSYAGAAGTTGTDREAIPVVEEQMRVGKREVSGGRVKVRSYVVETPVQEQVTLREEHVHVERRPVDREARMDEDYRDRTIEAEERTEQAVVSKDARVKEELVIGKTAEERTETVSDSVRHTEVEVEDERGSRLTGTTDRDKI